MTELAISDGFTIEQQEAIAAEAEAWFEKVPGARVPIVIGDGKNGAVIPGSPNPRKSDCDGQTMGITELRPGAAPIVGVCGLGAADLATLRRTVRHELGHALAGSGEHLGDNNVMAARIEHMADVHTDADVEFVASRL